MAQEQVQLEFREQLREMMLMQQQATMNPMVQQQLHKLLQIKLKLENLC